MEEQRAKNNQNASEEEEGRYALLDIKINYKAIVIKTAYFGEGIDKFTNRIKEGAKTESRHIHAGVRRALKTQEGALSEVWGCLTVHPKLTQNNTNCKLNWKTRLKKRKDYTYIMKKRSSVYIKMELELYLTPYTRSNC